MVNKSQLFKDVNKDNELYIITRDFMKQHLRYEALQKEYYIDESLYKCIYKKGIINSLKDKLASYYYDSKQGYIINMNTFKGTLTVLRQLSRYLKIPYRYDIIYLHSKYSIHYFFDL